MRYIFFFFCNYFTSIPCHFSFHLILLCSQLLYLSNWQMSFSYSYIKECKCKVKKKKVSKFLEVELKIDDSDDCYGSH